MKSHLWLISPCQLTTAREGKSVFFHGVASESSIMLQLKDTHSRVYEQQKLDLMGFWLFVFGSGRSRDS